MIVVTGAEGFIGGRLRKALEEAGETVISVDYESRGGHDVLDPVWVKGWLEKNAGSVEAIYHLGAVSATVCSDIAKLLERNIKSSILYWDFCAAKGIPLIYASSAATYGDGSEGFSDEVDPLVYRPTSYYGWSKHLMDLWALNNRSQPNNWYGLKFFNVYGPGEGNKGTMVSAARKFHLELEREGKILLFESVEKGIPDGFQARDFITVEDAVKVMLWILERIRRNSAPENGLYNVGTGLPATFLDIAQAVLEASDSEAKIEFITMPEVLRSQYQSFTRADMGKLRRAGYTPKFTRAKVGTILYVESLRGRE